MLRTGCAWRHLPLDFPPWQTTLRWFLRLARSGAFERMAHALAMADRKRVGRDTSPTAAVVDAQAARSGGSDVAGRRGYDAAKRVVGRKRHALVDTDGRLLLAAVSPADMHDSHGGVALLRTSRRPWPFLASVLRGSRLCRATRRRRHPDPRRACRAEARAARLRRATPSMGDRAHLRMDRTVPPPCPRPRSHAEFGRRLLRPRRRRHSAQAVGEGVMKRTLMPDRCNLICYRRRREVPLLDIFAFISKDDIARW